MGELRLDIAADTRDAVRGVKDIGKALDSVVDDLEKVDREGEDTARDLERVFRDAARDVSKSTDRMEKSAGDDFGGMSDNVSGFKDEAIQNLSEVASSFTGDLDDMASGVQGLTGGLASALTPGVGIPIAILGAAAGAFLASWQKSTEESEERVSAMFEDFAESGATFASEQFIGDAIKEIVSDTDKWKTALDRSKEAGEDIDTVLRAMAGDQEAMARVHAGYVRKRDDEVKKIKAANDEFQDQVDFIDAANLKLDEQTDWIRQIQGDTGTAAEKAKAYRDAMRQADDAISNIVTGTGTIDQKLQAIKSRNIEVGLKVDDKAYEQWAKRKRYIDVYVNPKTGTAGKSSTYKQPL